METTLQLNRAPAVIFSASIPFIHFFFIFFLTKFWLVNKSSHWEFLWPPSEKENEYIYPIWGKAAAAETEAKAAGAAAEAEAEAAAAEANATAAVQRW